MRSKLTLEIVLGFVEGRGGQRIVHVLKPDAARGQRRRIHLNVDGVLLLPRQYQPARRRRSVKSAAP
jgi:hypothetical protein